MATRPVAVPAKGLALSTTGEAIPVCPTCKLAIHPVEGAVATHIAIGTYCDGEHGHIFCGWPGCGWWREVNYLSDNVETLAREHVEAHF